MVPAHQFGQGRGDFALAAPSVTQGGVVDTDGARLGLNDRQLLARERYRGGELYVGIAPQQHPADIVNQSSGEGLQGRNIGERGGELGRDHGARQSMLP